MPVDRFRALRWLRLVAVALLPVWLPAQTARTAQPAHEIAVQPPPGRYGADTLLDLGQRVGGQRLWAAFIALNTGATLPTFEVREPILLSAAPGEERRYRLLIQSGTGAAAADVSASRELDYIIDRRRPAAPRLTPGAGTYQDEVAVSVVAADGDTSRVYYSVDGNPLYDGRPFAGEPVPLAAPPGQRRTLRLAAYAEDEVGNRSRVITATYQLDARHHAPPTLDVLSPVPGTFGNRQRLVIETSNVQWIRYSLDGRDPVEHGVDYQGPVELSIVGPIQLHVIAQPVRQALSPLVRSVDLMVVAEEAPTVVASSRGGVVSEGFQLSLSSPSDAPLFYSLDDRTPDAFDVRYSGAIEFTGFPGSRNLVPLRVRAQLENGDWAVERRLLFDLDNRVPLPPTLAVRSGRGGQTLSLEESPGSVIYYTLDGSEPDVTSRLYLSPFPVDEGTEVQAVAVSSAGLSSTVVRHVASATAQVTVPPPQIAVVADQPRNGVVEIGVTAASGSPAGTRVHFEAATAYDEKQEPPGPDLDSPLAPPRLVLAVPRGDRRSFALSAIAVGPTGVMSAPTVQSLSLDRTPAACGLPSVVESSDSASVVAAAVAAAGKVHYTLADDGSIPTDPSMLSEVLDELQLRGRPDDRVVYQLKVLCRSDAGNESDVMGPLEVVVDRRLPRVPVLRGFVDGALYADSEVALEYREQASLRLYYETTTDGSEPVTPTENSPLLTPTTLFGGSDGETTEFLVSILPVSASGEEGPIETISFSVDRGVPDPPFLAGFDDGAVYARPVTVAAVSPTLGNRLYVAVSPGAPIDQLIARSNLYSGAIEVDVAEDAETTFFVAAAEVDDASNESSRVTGSFTIDRRPPKAPAVRGVPATGIIREPALVQLAGGSLNVFYELTSDGSTPPVPGLSSHRYTEPLALAGQPDAEVVYHLRARAIDAVGNMSPLGPIHRVVVDRLAPPPPPPPTIETLVADAGAVGGDAVPVVVMSWEAADAFDIEFALLPVGGGDARFVPYEEPVEVTLPGRGGLIAWARRADAAGNRSEVVETLLAQQSVPAAPTVAGIADGVIYREAATAAFATGPGAVVRLEVATGGAEPPPVTEHSSVVVGDVTFDAMSGETVDYTVRARAFDPAGVAISAATRVTFTVDRTPPAPPVLLGAEDGEHYADDVDVTLLSSEGQIRYALARSVAGEDLSSSPDLRLDLPAADEFDSYEDSLTLRRAPGEIVEYQLAAYVVDEVGNSSTGLVEWTITIDDRVVYVAPSGSDDQTGTRTAPLLTLEHAILEAQRVGKREVHAAAGDYIVARPLVLGGDLLLIGGFDTDNWDRLGIERRSNLLPGRFVTPGDPLLSVTGGQITLRRLGLSDRGAPPKMPVVQVSGGELELADSDVLVTGVGGVAVRVDGGFVRIIGSELAASPQGAPLTLVRQRQGALLLSRSRLFGPAHGDQFTAVSITGTDDATLDRVTIDPGGALRTVGVSARDSQLQVDGGTLRSGSGTIRAVAISAERATLSLNGGELFTDGDAAYPIALEGTDTVVVIEGSRIDLDGALGVTGLRLRAGQLSVQDTTVVAHSTAEFTTLVDMAGGIGLLANTIMVAGDASESMVANLRDSRVDWVNNTLVAGSGRTLTAGIRLAGSSELRFVNNILARSRRSSSPAVAMLGVSASSGASIVANNLAGWDLLLALQPPPIGGTRDEGGLSDGALVDSLNLADGDPFGGAFDGNIGEPLERTFAVTEETEPSGVYRLQPESGAVNAGVPFSFGLNSPPTDLLGRVRPAPFVGLRPAPDLGALERY